MNDQSIHHGKYSSTFFGVVHSHPDTREFQKKLRQCDGDIRVFCRMHGDSRFWFWKMTASRLQRVWFEVTLLWSIETLGRLLMNTCLKWTLSRKIQKVWRWEQTWKVSHVYYTCFEGDVIITSNIEWRTSSWSSYRLFYRQEEKLYYGQWLDNKTFVLFSVKHSVA